MSPDACVAETTGTAARRRFLPFAAMLPTVLLLAAGGCTVETADEDASAGQEAPAAAGEDAPAVQEEEPTAAYDSVLAARLGADEYGMHTYVVALLTAGPNRDVDSATAAELQRAHLDNLFRMADEGSLLLQGPFLDDGTLRGFYIFNARPTPPSSRDGSRWNCIPGTATRPCRRCTTFIDRFVSGNRRIGGRPW